MRAIPIPLFAAAVLFGAPRSSFAGAPGTSAAPAASVDRTSAAPEPPEPSLLLGARVGAIFPQAFNKLDTSFLLDVELAWQLPFLHRHIGLFGDLSYSQPTAEGTRTTAQINNPVAWSLTQRDFGLTVGAQYLQFVTPAIALYGGAGVKIHFTRNVIDQHAGGADLGENSEDSTRIGPILRLGGGYRLGPGLLALELHYEWAPIKQLVTGDENTANLAVQLGYTVFLR